MVFSKTKRPLKRKLRVKMVTRLPDVVLTKRKRDILSLVSRGLTNQDIGYELGIAIPTVKYTLCTVYVSS